MSYETVGARELSEAFSSGNKIELIDVRSPGEFQSVHVRGAKNIPLDELNADQLKTQLNGYSGSVYVVCQSGGRSKKACEKLADSGLKIVNVDGGTAACVAAGLPVVKGKGAISLERQVRIAAGSLVFTGVLLGNFVHPYFYGLSGFVGAGLIFAGVTDTCAMGMAIAKMPWNRASQSSCTTSIPKTL